ncbi:sce7726 family protein [Pantoea sp. GL120224-02]|uniref:sce7726 family protein n=1 Tax=Pantoea sp. GL120224-02 TaxID=1378084 RepID=UPI000BD21B28|nr:sce7726 family protein [Pantoea sp. GL120224-02]SNY80017.1 hypothetical protein SAMN02744778_04925 [Pantoea sp. GL120224-02]
MNLNDAELREALNEYLKRLSVSPRVIIEELHIQFGQAIADVAAIYKEAHCYEIKGDNDNISRLKTQGLHYDKSFRKTTLITTRKHINNAIKTTPEHWGIIIFETDNNRYKHTFIRKATNSPYFNKECAVKILWRSEMIQLINKYNLNISIKINKRDLAQAIAASLPLSVIGKDVASFLCNRQLVRLY